MKQADPLTLCAAVLGIILCLALPVEASKVYRWVDESGKVHYTDEPKTAEQRQAEEVEIKAPVRQSDMGDNIEQQRQNAKWFDQRTAERQAQEAKRQKQRAKQVKANRKKRETCNKARYKYEDAEAELRARKRAGIKVKTEAKLKARLATYESDMKRKC
ncbi:MAG: DUF4124 domain-containing protein [Cellvibrionaceae bacterium]